MPVRYTIQHMQAFARERSGKCLSKDYFNDEVPLNWMCKRGHTFDYSWQVVNRGAWCMQCVKDDIGNERLEELQKVAAKKEGWCLSDMYINNHTKLKWKCKEGHRWEATAKSVTVHNSWCPYCSGNAPYTIEDMQIKAKERNGKCLSKVYIDSQTKLKWQCARLHTWMAKPNTIFRGSWCAKCAFMEQSERQRTDVAVYKLHAKKKGGVVLSIEYAYKKTTITWKCAKGHVWIANASQVINSGSWCPYCAGKAKHTIEEIQRFVRRKGGRCLSKTYTNSYTKLLFECAKKHTWKAIPTNVINNYTWCPVCAMDIKKFNLPQYKGMKKNIKERLLNAATDL